MADSHVVEIVKSNSGRNLKNAYGSGKIYFHPLLTYAYYVFTFKCLVLKEHICIFTKSSKGTSNIVLGGTFLISSTVTGGSELNSDGSSGNSEQWT